MDVAVARPSTAEPARTLDCFKCTTGHLGGLGFICAIIWLQRWGSGLPPELAGVLVLATTILPMVLYDVLVLRTYRDAATGLVWEPSALRPADGRRVAIKLLGQPRRS
jgi:hypothetical protein